MSITITAEGMDAAVRRMQRTLTALSGQEALTVLARALNRGLQSARAEALRIGRTAYTARPDDIFEQVRARRAGRSNLEATLEVRGRPGMSLIHFEATPNRPQRPGSRPADGVRVRIRKDGSRHAARAHGPGGSKSFVIRKPQGGYGVFVRHGQELEMLYGPTPVQALQRADTQERILERAETVFSGRLRHELDVLLSGLVRG